MPRATHYLEDGFLYHLTHRCHDRRFVLRCKCEREAYRRWLRIGAQRYGVPVLGYAVTSNHTHVVVEVVDRLAVGRMMQLAASAVAQQWNRRKGHEGAEWEHPYRCTRIQDGRHLINCLRYVDLNMVRAGVVNHPAAWRWCGYDELSGARQRYRIIDQERLLYFTCFGDMKAFAAYYVDAVNEKLTATGHAREPCWTEAIAVGDQEFVRNVSRSSSYRQRMEVYSASETGERGIWAVREAPSAYTLDSGQESYG